MKNLVSLTVVFVLAVIAISSPVWAAGNLKMPQANIVTPGADIPDDIRAFSGKWRGRWSNWACPPDHGLDAILIVEEVTQDAAKGQYSWGNSVGWSINPGCSPIKARFEKIGGKFCLIWDLRNGVSFHFWVDGGNLKGTRGGLPLPSEIIMKRF
ncbi:MAG: hypothetical protein Q8M54_04400 [Desulfobaccales bacterium]|nr:hypothetical protein [Desulfobaccales bacterium]